MLAARQKHCSVVKFLLDSNADIKPKNHNGHTALIEASISGDQTIISMLLENYGGTDADVDEKDVHGWNALMHATWEGHDGVVTSLVKHKANINSQNKQRNTPLSLASIKGHHQLVNFFVEQGASLFIRNNQNQTAKMQVEQLLKQAYQQQFCGSRIGQEVDVLINGRETIEKGKVFAYCQSYDISWNKHDRKEEKVLSHQIPFKQTTTNGWQQILNLLGKNDPIEQDVSYHNSDTAQLAEKLTEWAEQLNTSIKENSPPQISSDLLQKLLETGQQLNVHLICRLQSNLALEVIKQDNNEISSADNTAESCVEKSLALQQFTTQLNKATLGRHACFLFDLGYQNIEDFVNGKTERLLPLYEVFTGPEVSRLSRMTMDDFVARLGIHRNTKKYLSSQFGIVSPEDFKFLNDKEWDQIKGETSIPDIQSLMRLSAQVLEWNNDADVSIPPQWMPEFQVDLKRAMLEGKVTIFQQLGFRSVYELVKANTKDLRKLCETLSGPEFTRLSKLRMKEFLPTLNMDRTFVKYLESALGIICPEDFQDLEPKDWEKIKEKALTVGIDHLQGIQVLAPACKQNEETVVKKIPSYPQMKERQPSFGGIVNKKNSQAWEAPGETCGLTPSVSIGQFLNDNKVFKNFRNSFHLKSINQISMLQPQFQLHVVPRQVILALTRFIPFEVAGVRCVESEEDETKHWRVHGNVLCLETYSDQTMRMWVSVHDKETPIYREELVFISHRWLSQKHPDDENNTKLEHTQQLAIANPGWKYFWLDYMCVPQSKKRFEDQATAINSLPHYVKCCSSLITLCGNEGEASLTVYRKRGWCRLEQLSSVVPFYCEGRFGENFLCSTKHFIANKSDLSFSDTKLLSDDLLNPLKGDFFDSKDKFRIARALSGMCNLMLEVPRLHGLAAQILSSAEAQWTEDLSVFSFEAEVCVAENKMEQTSNKTFYCVKVLIPQVESWNLLKRYSDFARLYNELKHHPRLKNFHFPPKVGFKENTTPTKRRDAFQSFCKVLESLDPRPNAVKDFFFPRQVNQDLPTPNETSPTQLSPTPPRSKFSKATVPIRPITKFLKVRSSPFKSFPAPSIPGNLTSQQNNAPSTFLGQKLHLEMHSEEEIKVTDCPDLEERL